MKIATDKFKLYKFNMVIAILCTILLGVSYLQLKLPFIGIMFIIAGISSSVIFICYYIEKSKQ